MDHAVAFQDGIVRTTAMPRRRRPRRAGSVLRRRVRVGCRYAPGPVGRTRRDEGEAIPVDLMLALLA